MPHSFVASAAQLIDYNQQNQLFEQSKKNGKQLGAVGVSWSVGALGAVHVSAPGRRARVKPRTQIPFGKWVCVLGCVGCRRRAPTCATCGVGVHPVGRRGSGGGTEREKNAPSLRGRGRAPSTSIYRPLEQNCAISFLSSKSFTYMVPGCRMRRENSVDAVCSLKISILWTSPLCHVLCS